MTSKGLSFLHADIEDSGQTGRMPRLFGPYDNFLSGLHVSAIEIALNLQLSFSQAKVKTIVKAIVKTAN